LLGFRIASGPNDHYFTVALQPDGKTLLFLQAFQDKYDLDTWNKYYSQLKVKFTLNSFLDILSTALKERVDGTVALAELGKLFLLPKDNVQDSLKGWWNLEGKTVNEPAVKFPEGIPAFYLAVYVLPFVEKKNFEEKDVCIFPLVIPKAKAEDQKENKICPKTCKKDSKSADCKGCTILKRYK